MRNPIIYIALCLLVITACNKDKVETKPSLKITSISGDYVPINSDLLINFDFTDKEGDIDSMLIKSKRINQKVLPKNRDSIWVSIPAFNEKNRGELSLRLGYQEYLILLGATNPGTTPAPDSLILNFTLMDRAKHRSDSVSTGLIVVERAL